MEVKFTGFYRSELQYGENILSENNFCFSKKWLEELTIEIGYRLNNVI